MEKEVLVLAAQKYDFVNKEGKKVRGTKVHFTEIDKPEEPDFKGSEPTTQWFEGFEKFEEFVGSELPGKYRMEYDLYFTGKNKVSVDIQKFTYVQNV